MILMIRGMHKIKRFPIIHLLVAVLFTGALGNAVAGVTSCLPKACCCTKTMPQAMNHGSEQDMAVHCLPEKPAPCCQIEQELPTPQMAISTAPEVNPHRWLAAFDLAASLDPQQTDAQPVNRSLAEGREKIPIVPIYLQ